MLYVTPSGLEKFVASRTAARSPGLKNSNGGHKLFYVSSERRQLCAGAASVGVGPPLRLIFPLKVNHSTQSLSVSVKEGINQHISLSAFADALTGESAERNRGRNLQTILGVTDHR